MINLLRVLAAFHIDHGDETGAMYDIPLSFEHVAAEMIPAFQTAKHRIFFFPVRQSPHRLRIPWGNYRQTPTETRV